MQKQKINQKGFGAVEAILILVIIGLIGFVGWFVYNSNNKATDTLKNAAAPAVNNSQAGWLTFKQPKDPTTSFKYPRTWKLGTANGPDDGDGTKNVSVTSPTGTDIDMVSAGAGRGGDCLPEEHSTVSYVNKINGADNLYVVQWTLIDGGTSESGVDVLDVSQGGSQFAKLGDHQGCVTLFLGFGSTQGNKAGYEFGFNNTGKALSAKDQTVAREILGSLTVK